MKTIRIFVMLITCFVFSTIFINASEFSEPYPLRDELLATNEAGITYYIMNESWKPIKEYEGYYEISNLGNVKSLNRYVKGANGLRINNERILKLKSINGFYYTIHLWKNSKRKTTHVHRLVIEAFLPNPENKKYCNHKDGNKLNNIIENLEWVTASENFIHAIKNGFIKNLGAKKGHTISISTRKKIGLANRGIWKKYDCDFCGKENEMSKGEYFLNKKHYCNTKCYQSSRNT